MGIFCLTFSMLGIDRIQSNTLARMFGVGQVKFYNTWYLCIESFGSALALGIVAGYYDSFDIEKFDNALWVLMCMSGLNLGVNLLWTIWHMWNFDIKS
jgi:ABC-type antimicrobial peptide transport system permease subunit